MAEAAEPLLTLTEVSSRTGISMPTLQRYKKLYQSRIPSVGKGRSQRYPENALEVFHELKKENVGRRGRPRKNKSPDAPKAAQAAAKSTRAPKKASKANKEGLLTLTQISEMTEISYPTLLRYVKTHLRDIPHRGAGRARRFLPEAVEVFKTLRGQSRRGRRKKSETVGKAAAAGTAASADLTKVMKRMKDLEQSHKELEKELAKLRKQLAKPFKISLPFE